MKKYKLIKEYPGSHSKGKEYHQLDDKNRYYQYTTDQGGKSFLLASLIINNPEFFEEVVEKTYEILSYINPKGDLFHLGTGGLYYHASWGKTVGSGIIPKHSAIHSIKRLSDGEIFTIGDCVQSSLDRSKIPFAITEFIPYPNPNKSNDLGINKSDTSWAYTSLEYLTPIKKPLYTTDDGVDIFMEHIDLYWVNKLTNKLEENYIKTWSKTIDSVRNSFHIFLVYNNAKLHALKNTPCLTLIEVMNNASLVSTEKNRLLEIVKTKAKI